MKFWVRSKKDVEESNPLVSEHIIISIYTPFDRPPRVKRNQFTRDILQLAFDDLDNPGPSTIRAMGEVVLFNEEMADKILAFVKENDDIKTVVVHCDAGISRSSGTAAALSKYYTGDDSEYFSSHGMYGSRRFSPNMRVYRILLNKLYGGREEQVSSSGS